MLLLSEAPWGKRGGLHLVTVDAKPILLFTHGDYVI